MATWLEVEGPERTILSPAWPNENPMAVHPCSMSIVRPPLTQSQPWGSHRCFASGSTSTINTFRDYLFLALAHVHCIQSLADIQMVLLRCLFLDSSRLGVSSTGSLACASLRATKTFIMIDGAFITLCSCGRTALHKLCYCSMIFKH